METGGRKRKGEKEMDYRRQCGGGEERGEKGKLKRV